MYYCVLQEGITLWAFEKVPNKCKQVVTINILGKGLAEWF